MTFMTHEKQSELGAALRRILENPAPYLKIGAVIVWAALFWADMQGVKRDVADIKAFLRAPRSTIVQSEDPLTMLKHAP